MIRVTRLSRATAGPTTISYVDLHVRAGEVVALVGRRSGRSTLLRQMAGLVVPDRGDTFVDGVSCAGGDIFVDGVSCASASFVEADALRRRIGYLADDDTLSFDCDVRSNLWEPLRNAPGPLHGPMRMSWALRLAGLDERVLDALPGSLPIGDRRRICVARAILHTPDILLIDSPLRDTDPADHGDILATLIRSRDTLGATMILALDELCAIPVVADRVVVLYAGRVDFDGDVTAFLRSGIGLDRPA